MKNCSVGTESFQVDRQTDGQKDMMELIDAFRNIANMIKILL